MKTIKYLFLSFALLSVGNMMAQKSFTVKDVTIAPGGQADLVVGIDVDGAMCAADFLLTLPDGITADGAAAKKAGVIAETDHVFSVQKKDNGDYLTVIYSMMLSSFKANKGDLVSIPLSAGSIAEGKLQGKIHTITISNEDEEEFNPADVTFNIIVSNGDGIKGITVDDLDNAKVYTVGGQRVEGKAAKKGVYVVNGKKVVVK